MNNMIISAVLVLMTTVSALAQLPPEIDPSEVCQPELQGQGCWMELKSHPGCYVWNTEFSSEETATWTGECAAGRIQGTGTVTWKWVAPSGKVESAEAEQYPCDQWTNEMLFFFVYAVPQHVRNCLAAGADPNARDEFNEETPLHMASWGKSVRVLLEAGADPHARTKRGETPLHSIKGPVAIQALIDAGADLEARDGRGRTPLLFHARFGGKASVRVLLEAGANAHARTKNGGTALHEAASSDDPGVIPIFLQEGLRVGARDLHGRTPLHYAAMNNWRQGAKAVQVLVAAGADVLTRDERGETPLHLAARNSVAAVKALLAFGADPNARAESGETPLHSLVNRIMEEAREALNLDGTLHEKSVRYFTTALSARFDNGRSIPALLEGGADPNARDAKGRTPWDLVQASGPKEQELFRDTEAYWTLNDARFQKPTSPVAAPDTEELDKVAETGGKCEIPGYLEAVRSGNAQTIDWKNLGLPWCPASTDLQVRAIALKIAVAQCGLATSQGAEPEKVKTLRRQIRESCAQLKALGSRLGSETCQCPSGLDFVALPSPAAKPASGPLPEAEETPDRKRNLPTCADGDTVPINVAEGKKLGCPPSKWCAWDACQGDRECRSAYPECEPGVLQ